MHFVSGLVSGGVEQMSYDDNPNHQLCWGEWSKQERVGQYIESPYIAMRKVLQANFKTKEVVHMDNKSLLHFRGKIWKRM